MTERLDVRAALRDRIARGIRALAPEQRDPDTLAQAALDALDDGCEWLTSLAEEYQQRAHRAEAALADLRAARRTRAPATRWPQLALGAALDAVSILCLTLAALWVSDWAQRHTGSSAVGWFVGFGVVLSPLAALVAWRGRRRQR